MTTILIKKKDTAGAPAAGDLTNAAGGAEIAVNTATKRIYSKDSGGTIIEMGTFPSVMSVQGNLSATGTLGITGATNLNGAVTLGDASADNITVTGTITSNLLFTDATYDIGASGANRPRDMFLSRNLTVGGTLTLAGGVNLNGNVTIGDSSADTLTVNSTITSNLIFTDNTYDIGASGATRPRSLFLGTNLTVGSLTSGRVPYASTAGLIVDSANLAFSGNTLSVVGASGITSFTGTTKLALNISGSTSTNDYSGIDLVQGVAGTPKARVAAYFAGGGSYLQFGTSNSYGSGITNTAMTIDPNQFVGMGGRTSPSTFLEVQNYSGSSTPPLRVSTYDGGSSTAFGLGFYITTYGYDIARINGRFTSSGGGGYGDLDFATSYNGSVTTKATLTQWGIFSVGSTDPTPYTNAGSASGQSAIVTYNTATRYGDVVLVKGNSGTANQGSHLVNFKNYGPANIARAQGTQLGGMYFQASQPTSGALQDAASILCVAEAQSGNSTSSQLQFYTNSVANGNALAMIINSGRQVTVGSTEMTSGTFNIYGSNSSGDAATFFQNNAAGGYSPTTRYAVQLGGTTKYQQLYNINVDAYGSGNCSFQVQDSAGNYQTVMQAYGGVAGGALNVGTTGRSYTLAVGTGSGSSNRSLNVGDGTNGVTIGTWDATNVRFEATGRPLYLTSYNTGGVVMGYAGNTNAFSNSSIPFGVSTNAAYQSGDSFACGGRANIQSSSANVVNAYAAGTGYGGAGCFRAASERSASTGMYFFHGVSSATSDGSTGTQNIIIYNNGNIQNTNNSYGTLSDVKLKKDITPAGSQWDDVKAMARVMSKFVIINDVNQTRQLGWVAQDLKKVSPGLVYSTPDYETDADGNMVETGTETLGVHTSVAHLKAFKALGEALERIEQLEARLAAANIN